MRCAVAESLALRRSQGEDGADKIEEETVDETKQVAHYRCAKSQVLPVFAYDLDTDNALAKRRSPEWDAGIFSGAPPLPCSTRAPLWRLRERRRVAHVHACAYGRGDIARLPDGHAGLARQQVRQIRVVPALDRRRNRPPLGVKAVRRDGSALLVDENLDSADRGAEGLLHAEPLLAAFSIVVTIGTAVPGPKTPFGRGRSQAPACESPTLFVRI